MSKLGEFTKKRKKGLVIVAIIAVIAILVIMFLGGNRAAIKEAPPLTTKLERTELKQVVAANGTVKSATSRKVTSNLTFKITEVLVDVGDIVEKGQELVKLDLSDLDKTIADTRKTISTAAAQDKLRLEQAQRKLQEAVDSRDINLKKNDTAVQNALNTLNSANNVVATARNTITAAQAAIEGYVNALRKGQDVLWASGEVLRLETELALASTQEEIDRLTAELAAAKAYLATLDSTLPDVTTATANLANLQVAHDANVPLEQQKILDAQRSLATAEPAQQNAQVLYDKAVEARDSIYRADTISVNMSKDAVDTLKITDSAQAMRTQLSSQIKQREDAIITAPISGVITVANATVGNTPGTMGMSAAGATGITTGADSLFTIEDTNNLEILTAVPEYDISQLQLGMQVDITTDALDGETWSGTVKETSPTAADANGNFSVTVAVTSKLGQMAIGMSAKLNIVVDSKQNVYVVPYDALTTNSQNQTVIVVWDEKAAEAASVATASGTPPARREIVVETGMETDYYVEISGAELADGMEILNDPEGKNVVVNMPMFMAGG